MGNSIQYFTTCIKKLNKILNKSNVHNLIHLVEEVKKFGKLQIFNAYPFENKLSSIKRTVRNRNKPLQQKGNRLTDWLCLSRKCE